MDSQFKRYLVGLLFGSGFMYAGIRGMLLMEQYSFGMISADLGTIYAVAFTLGTGVTFTGGLLYTGWVSRNIITHYGRGKTYGQFDLLNEESLTWKEDLAIAGLWLGTPISLGLVIENLIIPLISIL